MRAKQNVGCYQLFSILGLFLCLLSTSSLALAQNPQLQVRGKPQYVHGVNLGWMFQRYASDIGKYPLHPEWGSGYNSATADSWLRDIQQMKVNVVRLWLFEGLEGLEFDTNGYVTGLQPEFLTNLDDLMSKANALGLAFELVLLNHSLDDEIGQDLPSKTPENNATVKNIVTDATARSRFIARAVRPLVQRYSNNLAVFSYDIMNEADLAINRGVCNQTQLRTLIRQVAFGIHAVQPTAQVTCSCAFYKFLSQTQHNGWFGGLGLDYYENHNYASTPKLPTVPAFLDKPLLLGEYGPSLPPPLFKGTAWTAAEQNTAAIGFITQAKNRGWAGSMAWMYWHSPNNGESLVLTPGGNQNWEPAASTIRTYGIRYLTPTATAIYKEALATDWESWSWDSTVVFNDTTRAFAGLNSIKITSTAGFSALSLRKGTEQSTSGFTKLRFRLYSTTVKPFSVFIQTTDGGAASPTVSVSSTANTWKEVLIPLTSFGSPASIKRINLQSLTATAIGEHWVDEMELIP